MSMPMQFSQPSSGDWFKPAEHHGHLILVTKVHELGTKFDNLSARDKEFAIVDLVDLDETNPQLRAYVSDNHPGFVNKLKKAHRTGEFVLGRIEQQASDKGNPAWVLGQYTPGHDDARAAAWLTANPLNSFGQPANRPAPAPQPVQQYAPAPQPQQQYAPQPVPQYAPPQPQYAPPAPAPQPVQQYAPAPAPQPQQQYAPAPAAQYQQEPATAFNPGGSYAPELLGAPQAPTPQPVQQAAPVPAPQLDPNNLPPEVAALLAQLQNPQTQQA